MSAACCAADPHQRPAPPDYPEKHIYVDCVREADEFKWIQSERAGYDLGEAAIRQWVKEHWSGYLRARWVEHLQGACFWVELDRGDFGLLDREFFDKPQLLAAILDKLKTGKENLDLIVWACSGHADSDPVIEILTALDINSRRLIHQFEAP